MRPLSGWNTHFVPVAPCGRHPVAGARKERSGLHHARRWHTSDLLIAVRNWRPDECH